MTDAENYRVIEGDVLASLAGIPDGSVQCVVTSPPYWGLRDYGVAGQIGTEATFAEYVDRCRNSLCCNPSHLEPIDHVDHARIHGPEGGRRAGEASAP